MGQLWLSAQLFLPGQDGSLPASSGCSPVLAAHPRSSPSLLQTPWCRGGRASNGHICSEREENQSEISREDRRGRAGGWGVGEVIRPSKEPAHLKQLSNHLRCHTILVSCLCPPPPSPSSHTVNTNIHTRPYTPLLHRASAHSYNQLMPSRAVILLTIKEQNVWHVVGGTQIWTRAGIKTGIKTTLWSFFFHFLLFSVEDIQGWMVLRCGLFHSCSHHTFPSENTLQFIDLHKYTLPAAISSKQGNLETTERSFWMKLCRTKRTSS